MSVLANHGWRVTEVNAALEALAHAAGLPVHSTGHGEDATVERGAARLGLEAEPAAVQIHDIPTLLERAGPAILRIVGDDGDDRIIALLRGGRRGSVLVGPHGVARVPIAELISVVGRPLVAPAAAAIDALLDKTRIEPRRRERARAGLLRERLAARQISGIWLVRLPTTSALRDQLRAAGVLRGIGVVVAAHAAQYVLAILGWWTIGGAALEGRIDRGWLCAWALLLLTLVPLRLVELLAQGRIATVGASVVKRRLLEGALRLHPEEMRAEGAGQLLGRTLEANTVETLASSRGVSAVMAFIDLMVAMTVLALGAAPLLPVIALTLWVVSSVFLAVQYTRRRRVWTDARLGLTHDLVERMVGHRTRVAQEPRERWHETDDRELTQYLADSRALDRSGTWLTILAPAGFVLVGIASLVPALVSATAKTSALAVSLGGVLLGARAIKQLALGSRDLATFAIAWRRVRLLFASGGRTDLLGSADRASPSNSHDVDPDAAVLSAQGLVFRYRGTGDPVLRGCDLRIGPRDRILLEGPSGGGKSTLAQVIAGIGVPESGTVLVNGLDRHTTGPVEWRRRIAFVPQFHENHVISATFAFNLLMGRAWPPAPEDLTRAEEICRELGLGRLLDTMPAGLQQSVGETGWQLSHGERSRVYIARALLQSPTLVVLDESFAALDPETLQRALACVTRRADALIVVAHP